MTTIRVGLVGCGTIARAVHLRVLQDLPGVQVTAIADTVADNLDAARSLAAGAAAFTDFRALIDSGGVDAVVICLPTALHAPAAVAALSAGQHVYCEKPIATSMSDAASVLAAWRVSGRVGMAGFNFRYHPQITGMRRRVRAGDIGTVVGMQCTFAVAPHALPDWKRRRDSGGGALLDLASHHVDLAHFLLDTDTAGAIASVRSLGSEHEHASLQLRMMDDTMVQAFVSLASAERHHIEVIGTTGRLVFDRTELARTQLWRADLSGARLHRLRRAVTALDPFVLLRSPGHEVSFRRSLAAFVGAIRGDIDHERIRPDLLDGAKSLAVIDAAERSLITHALEAPRGVGEYATSHPAVADAAR